MMKYFVPTMVFQERNAVQNHSEQMVSYGKKALIVTGKHSSKENGALQDVIDGLEKHQTAYVVFDRISENPTIASVMEAATLGRTEGTDFVIGIGGGSPLDAAKAIALMIQNRDTSKEILYQNVKLRHLPVVEVPTTCGTGSEVTPYAILTRDDIQTKQSISHLIYPELALVDGKYLKHAPMSVITNTAIDALGHMLESYFHTKATDYSRMFAQYAMEVWSEAAKIFFEMDVEEETYDQLMFASSLAGMAITHTGTSLPHGLSYYLTYHKGIPHGKAVGIFLPGYLRAVAEEYEAQVVMALRALGFGSIEQFDGFIREMLGKISVTENDIETMVQEIAGNQKKLSAAPIAVTKDTLETMCREALHS